LQVRGFHSFHEEGDLASHDIRHDARTQLVSTGADVVGFGQHTGTGGPSRGLLLAVPGKPPVDLQTGIPSRIGG